MEENSDDYSLFKGEKPEEKAEKEVDKEVVSKAKYLQEIFGGSEEAYYEFVKINIHLSLNDLADRFC